ncbi:ACT domain-containing protein [Amnibacterium sp. CER49]|uniref:ACT domain-containing protein n=1 Tax=Amnibacterium sp. CER49 TaxID=3039161 RepID=UPI00244C078E|nr:ACT domain-containing protein [Amnibacterium sp. CER49]MDH2443443.1 ACT domain-containing protein [Amnibacterium sp. CER49]
MTAERDLTTLLRAAQPVVAHREVVLVTVPADAAARLPALATVTEDEGVTVVLARADAERLGLPIGWIGTWITLRVHSALEAVGLTAATSSALARAGISCNVLAGFHHDHLLVPHDRADDALGILRTLGG